MEKILRNKNSSTINKYLKQRHYADIETKGFWDSVHTDKDVWCLCSITEDNEVLLFHDYPEFDNVEVYDEDDDKTYTIPVRTGTLIEGARYWYAIGANGGKLSIHNCETFDRPIIEKVWPKCVIPSETWEDTFVQSKVQWYDRKCPKGAKSAHGLHAYGIKFGIKKPPIADFTTMDAYKLNRVIEDCRIQKMTAEFLDKEAVVFKDKFNISFDKVIKEIEQPYARLAWKQELKGAKIDIDHVKSCIKFLDKETGRLSSYIEPNLPMTLKKKTAKIGRSELAETLLGKNVRDIIDDKGDMVKSYYKPSINFHKVEKCNNYSGFHISYGESPTFVKKRDLTTWIKNYHPDTKPKEWDIQKVELETKLLNQNTCDFFDVEPTDTDLIAAPHTRVEWLQSKLTQHEIVKGYLIKQGVKWADVWNDKKTDGFLERAEQDIVIKYPKSAHPDNQISYEVSKGEVIKTSPKFGSKEYEQLGEDAEMGQDIAKYNTFMHRRRFFSNVKDPDNKGLMSYIREDGRVPCGLGNFMTSTGRSNQRVVVNLPSDSSLYGKEMRQAIIADEGKMLVGVDQKSSQLSIAAFIADNQEYYNAVATGVEFRNDEEGNEIYVGTSAHCVNARNFGLVSKSDWEEAARTQNPDLIHDIVLKRKSSKGPSFGVLFGCAGKKLGLMLDIPASEGNYKKNRFLSEMGLDTVIDYVKCCERKYPYGGGFFIPVYGYWLWCRGANVGVNYFCQGLESIVQKKAVIDFHNIVESKGWGDHTGIILTVHDEVLIETNPDLADEVGKIMCSCYTKAGKDMLDWYKENEWAYPAGTTPSICVDFSGGYAKGKNYYECH